MSALDRLLNTFAYSSLGIVAALLSVCCAARPRIANLPATPTPWCFRATLRVSGNDQAAMACWAVQSVCEKARHKAATMGGLMGLREVGGCWEAR